MYIYIYIYIYIYNIHDIVFTCTRDTRLTALTYACVYMHTSMSVFVPSCTIACPPIYYNLWLYHRVLSINYIMKSAPPPPPSNYRLLL